MKRLITAGTAFFCLLLSSDAIYGNDGTGKSSKTYSIEEIPIVSMLDSLTGNMFAGRFRVPLETVMDTAAIPLENLPRFSDSVLMKNILAIQSEIPMAFNDRVKRYIEVYSIDKRAKAEVILGLTEVYFPLFEEALDRRNLPHHLKYLAIIESALNANAVSRSGATGLWQIMYSTGRMLGLEINSYVDERRDPYRSTEAALDYLEKLHGIYGDWLLAIAAYNCGPGHVNKAIARAGGERNFWKMQHFLPAETRGYVPAFLGSMYVFSHYKDFELKAPKPMYSDYPTDTVMVYKSIGLSHIASELGMEADEILFLNPSLKKKIVPVSKEGYPLKLPVSQVAKFVALKDSIYANMPDPEKELLEQSQITASMSKIASSDGTQSKLLYTVKSGDNLGYISEWYDCSVQQIKNWNGMYNNTIKVGQKLTIYVPKNKYNNYLDVNSMSFREKQEWKASGGSAKSTSANVKHDSECNCVYYTVRSGDTLWDISQKYRVSVDEIKKHNNDIGGKELKPGMVLKIVLS